VDDERIARPIHNLEAFENVDDAQELGFILGYRARKLPEFFN